LVINYLLGCLLTSPERSGDFVPGAATLRFNSFLKEITLESNTSPWKVAVCMTAYNQEKYIAQAIESVISQKANFPFCLVIGEDCSTDRTLDICLHYQALYPDTVFVYHRPRNLGVSRNYCATYSQCNAKYIANLDGDDFWHDPYKLFVQAEFMDMYPGYSMCFATTKALSSNKKIVHWPPHSHLKRTYTFSDILSHSVVANCSVMYRSSALPSLDFYSWLLKLPLCDFAIHSLFALQGKVKFIDAELATYRLHSDSVFDGKPFVTRLEMSSKVYEALSTNLPEPYCHKARQMLVLAQAGLAVLNYRKPSLSLSCLKDGIITMTKLPFPYFLAESTVVVEQITYRIRSRKDSV
jgi:glycosyltransferase involved in cell wall biosynthesis